MKIQEAIWWGERFIEIGANYADEMHSLMRQINDTGRTVSWGEENWLRDGKPTTEYSAAVFKKGSSKVTQMWTDEHQLGLYCTVHDWAVGEGVIKEEA